MISILKKEQERVKEKNIFQLMENKIEETFEVNPNY